MNKKINHSFDFPALVLDDSCLLDKDFSRSLVGKAKSLGVYLSYEKYVIQ